MNKEYLDREKVLSKAVDDCLREMFERAQPSADLDNINAEYKEGKIDEEKDGPIYDRHYLSHAEFDYVLNKYMKAYRINGEWEEDIEVLEKYLKEGGHKDKYIKDWDDEYGHHPGYRDYEEVPPLKNHIREIIDSYLENKELNQTRQDLTEDITNKVMELIGNCKNYYSFNMDEQKFRNTICMTCSPSGSIETVKKWWKDHYDVDIEIEERNPLLFWDQDYYGDSFEEIMEEEDGPDWKEKWDKKWKKQEAKKKAERDKKLAKLKKQIEKEQKDEPKK